MNPFHQRRMTRIALTCALAATLAACGGGSSTSDTASKTGYFIDSAVQGLQYQSGSHSGVTGSDGAFQYEEGQPVTFSIGSLELGRVTVTNSRVFPVDLIAGAKDETHPKVSLMAQILQTLDSDGDASNGITITDGTRQALNQVVSLASADPAQAAATLTGLLATATQGRATTLVAASTAQSHLKANLVQEYAGNWSGSFSGGDKGDCQVVISPVGVVSGTCTSAELGGGTANISGMVSSSGDSTATSGSASTGATFTGVYSRDGKVTGQWRNSQYNLSGFWTLKKV
jgi:hypothetical protein